MGEIVLVEHSAGLDVPMVELPAVDHVIDSRKHRRVPETFVQLAPCTLPNGSAQLGTGDNFAVGMDHERCIAGAQVALRGPAFGRDTARPLTESLLDAGETWFWRNR